MNQPPDGNFYNTSTEHFDPQQQRPAQAPGYPQRPMPPNYPPPWNASPNQGPLSQHDFPTLGAQNYATEQGPVEQLDFPKPNAQNYASNQGALNRPDSPPQNSQRSQSYPPPQGPVSQPGFSPATPRTQRPANQPSFTPQGYPQQGAAPNSPGQRPPWAGGNYSPPQGPASSPGPQQPNIPPFGGGFPPMLPQEQRGAPPNWPEQAPSQPPPAKKTGRTLMIAVLILALLIAGSTTGFLVLHLRGNNASTTPTTITGTITTTGTTTAKTATPAPTPTTATTANGVGTPVQAGPNWLVTVTGVKTTTSSLIAPNAGNTYLEISLSLKNVSTQAQTLVGIIQFTLADASGHVYSETATDTNVHQLPYGKVNGGQTFNAQIAYEVPETQHTFKLSFAYGLSSGNSASVSWNLSA